MPASTVTQSPATAVVDVHDCPAGHLLPLIPRQPGEHLPLGTSHMRPEAWSPQSVSPVQPHTRAKRQREPSADWAHGAGLAAVHPTHVLLAVSSHTFPSGQSVSCRQPMQVLVNGSHTGAASGQSALTTQPAQRAVAVSHTAVLPVQAMVLVAEHCPHAPFAPHARIDPAQSESDLHPTQLCVAKSQTGLVPGHVALARHSTHMPVSR
jgi:hypothetical protein